jgi:hypothetical protein
MLMTRIIAKAVVVSMATFALVAPPAGASSERVSIALGEVPQLVSAAYPSVDVPTDTNLFNVTLPAGFDWAPTGLSDPSPSVTWAIEQAGTVVGAGEAPDSGSFQGFGLTGAIDFSTLPTDPPVGTGYALHIRGVWPSSAALDKGYVVDLRAPFAVTSAGGGGDIAFDLSLASATTEDRTISVSTGDTINGGATLQLSTTGAEAAWDWATGPDPAHPWVVRPIVVGGIGTGAVDPTAPPQTLDGPFSITTPSQETLVVPLPDVVYYGAKHIALKIAPSAPPVSGPIVTTYVNVTTSFSTGMPQIVMNAKPVLSGLAMFGRSLTVTKGSWSVSAVGTWGSGPLVSSYQWYRNGIAIAGGTTATHPIIVADIGKALTVRVTTRFAGYGPAGFTVAAGVVQPAPAPRMVKAPYVGGTAAVARVVTARFGAWSPAPTSFRYQWRRDGVAIKGATGISYTLPASMRGHYVTVTVTTVRAGYLAASATTVRVLVT